jgi:hypothetical protein
MAKTNKKGFILYVDMLEVLDELTDEQAGQLFKEIKNYTNPNKPTGLSGLSGLLKAIFVPFKNQIDRDEAKYENICLRNSQNGKKGGRPKNPKTQTNPNKPRKAHTDTDKDKDKDIYSNLTVACADKLFESFWNTVPANGRKRSGKLKALTAWKKMTEEEQRKAFTAIEIFKSSEDWSKENGKYVPGIHRWLRDKFYDSVEGMDKEPPNFEREAKELGLFKFARKYGDETAAKFLHLFPDV